MLAVTGRGQLRVLEGPFVVTEEHKAALDSPDLEPGEVIGDYRVVEKIARGAFGAVFRAERIVDQKAFAIKVLSSSKARQPRFVQRFANEVRAAALVRHPSLVRVYDLIEQSSPPRIASVMEFLPGETLRARLARDGALPLPEAIHIAMEVSDGVSALHEAGILHRDLKPENVMLLPRFMREPQRVKVLDLSVVKFLHRDKQPTPGAVLDETPGLLVGTPRYMAPEQAAGLEIDERADVFALGVMLFEMIGGRCPHEGESLRDVMLAKLENAPRITLNPEREILPHELSELVDSCLRTQPTERPVSAKLVRTRLHEAECVLSVVGPVHADGAEAPDRKLGSAHGSGRSPSTSSRGRGAPSGALGTREESGSGPRRRHVPPSLFFGVGALLLLTIAFGLAAAVKLYLEGGTDEVVQIPVRTQSFSTTSSAADHHERSGVDPAETPEDVARPKAPGS